MDVVRGMVVTTDTAPGSTSEVAMAGFLTHLFDERKISVGAIKNYSSAITYHGRRLSGYNPPLDDHVMKNLFNSCVRDRSVVTKKVVDWDIRLVLEFFMSGRGQMCPPERQH